MTVATAAPGTLTPGLIAKAAVTSAVSSVIPIPGAGVVVRAGMNAMTRVGTVAARVGTGAATGAAKLAKDGIEAGAGKAAQEATGGAASKPLLGGGGGVGTFDDLINEGVKGDNITPHHIPSANRMALEGVSKGDGIAMNMEHPFPRVGGRHKEIFTYGTATDINMTGRDALAAGVRDARQIYQSHGLYLPQIRSSLQEVIDMNKAAFPSTFAK